MKKLFIASLVIAIVATVPTFLFAATYQYVNTSGNLSSVSANSAGEALTVRDIARTSGVRLVSDSLIFTSFIPAGSQTYQYVNTSGRLSTVTADSAAQALTVSDIARTSGVMLVR